MDIINFSDWIGELRNAASKIIRFNIAFPTDVSHLIPKDIPKDFYYDNKWSKLASKWFFNDLSKLELKAKKDIDKEMAIRHLAAILGSWEPKHEDKIAAVGYLMSLWFE